VLDEDKLAEIEALRAEARPTRRAVAPALEAILYEPLKVLDHGFVRVVDYMGDDAGIVQAARVSYGRGTKQVSSDRGLINYLMRHRHTSPFEMCEIKLHLKMPIFVARQWIRHRTANVNEYSARYSILEREFYVPDAEYLAEQRAVRSLMKQESQSGQVALLDLFAAQPEAVAAQSQTNKQGRDEAALEREDAFEAADAIKRESQRAYTFYTKLLNERADGSVIDPERQGIARELARMVLPLNTYTQMYWKIDLHNLLHFLQLRADSHAQHEIRAYADVLLDVVRRWVPLTAVAFEEYRRGAAQLSARSLEAVRRRLRGERVTREDVGLSAGEWSELVRLVPELADGPVSDGA
jgi:thymidylate synthase (FAD)